VLSVGTLASVAFVPAPNTSAIRSLIRPDRSTGAVTLAPLPAGPRRPTTVANTKPTGQPAAAIGQRPPRTEAVRRRPAAPLIGLNALPPVSVVPAAAGRGRLDSLVVPRAATLPPSSRPAGGVIMSASGGSRGRGGFAAVRPTVVGGDSARATARGGGRAVLVARPDTTRPPE
jgi:hypothetical protein